MGWGWEGAIRVLGPLGQDSAGIRVPSGRRLGRWDLFGQETEARRHSQGRGLEVVVLQTGRERPRALKQFWSPRARGSGGEITGSWGQVCAAARSAREKWVTGWSVGDRIAGPTVVAGGPAGL